MVLAGIIGLSGCWSQSSNKLLTTAAIQLFAALVGAIAMATWHAALFLEMEKVHRSGFPLTWPDWLQESTTVGVGWSYFLVIFIKTKNCTDIHFSFDLSRPGPGSASVSSAASPPPPPPSA